MKVVRGTTAIPGCGARTELDKIISLIILFKTGKVPKSRGPNVAFMITRRDSIYYMAHVKDLDEVLMRFKLM